MKKEIAKDLRGKGIGRRQANKYANQAINKYQAALNEGFQATQIRVKVTAKTSEVILSSVQLDVMDEIKEEIKEEIEDK